MIYNKIFEDEKNIEIVRISEDDEEFDVVNELAHKLKVKAKIGISYTKNVTFYATDETYEKVFGAAWVSELPSYSFDIIVDENFRSMGIANMLVQTCISDYKNYKDIYGYEEEYYMEIECVNPFMEKILEKNNFIMYDKIKDSSIWFYPDVPEELK